MKRCVVLFALLLLVVLLAVSAAAATSSDFTYDVTPDGIAIIIAYTGNSTELNIDWNIDGHMIMTIGGSVFRNNQGIRSVPLPIGVRVIRESAFERCKNLSKTKLPSMLETIEDRAFAGCDSLKSVFLPDSVNELGTSDLILGRY